MSPHLNQGCPHVFLWKAKMKLESDSRIIITGFLPALCATPPIMEKYNKLNCNLYYVCIYLNVFRNIWQAKSNLVPVSLGPEPEISALLYKTFFCDYITHNAAKPLSDVSRGHLVKYMHIPLEPQRALYYLFFHDICSSMPQDL